MSPRERPAFLLHQGAGAAPTRSVPLWDVRIACHGATRPKRMLWRGIPAEHPWEAIAAAFEEHHWPESFDAAGSPYRLTVTVTGVGE